MLVVVLILMLVGFGMLVVASVTATSTLAWVSVAASVLGAAVLVRSWRHKAVIAADEQHAARATLDGSRWAEAPAAGSVPAAPASEAPSPAAAPQVDPWRPVSQPPVSQPSVSQPSVSQSPVRVPPAPQPGDQQGDPVSGVLGAMLDRQVLVVDEQPAYHLPGCPVLSGRQVVGVTVKDAIGLDFTPCAVCTPLRVLASTGPTHENLAGRQQ